MNEKIKELAEKCWVEDGDCSYGCGRPDGYFDQEKFAELILRECADVMDGRDENGNAKDGQYLLTKFGIDASQRYT
jgi:hypothetical protein